MVQLALPVRMVLLLMVSEMNIIQHVAKKLAFVFLILSCYVFFTS